MTRTTETPQALELGLLLKKFRNAAAMSQQALAAQLGLSHSDVSRRENGRQGMDETQLGAHLGALSVTGDDYEQAVAVHRAAKNPNWIARGVDRQLAVVSEYEDAASRILNVQPSLVPGPLQTRQWAIDLGRRGGSSPAEAAKGADFRMSRAGKILGGDVEFEAIIGEYALRYPACEDEIVAEQLRHLLEVAGLPHVTIRLVSIRKRYTDMRAGSFVLIESSELAVVHLEQLGGSTTLTDAKYVRRYQEAADNLRIEAMSPTATEELIAQMIDDLERT